MDTLETLRRAPVAAPAPPSRRAGALAYAACYAVYALFLGGLYLGFWAWRRALHALAALAFGASGWAPFAYLIAVVLLGIGLVVLAFVAEAYLRAGARTAHLAGRAARLALALAAALAAGAALQSLAPTA